MRLNVAIKAKCRGVCVEVFVCMHDPEKETQREVEDIEWEKSNPNVYQ